MKLVRFLSTTLGIFFIASVGFSGVARAEVKVCDFGTKIEDLKKIQARENREDSAGIIAELKIRKDLLKITATCLKDNTAALDAELALIKTPSPEMKAFIEWMHRQLQENIAFYSYKETQIDTLGIQGAKDIARELASRKAQADTTLENLVLSILDWDSNQPLFETGSKRFSDIKKTLDAFKLPSDHEVVALEKEAFALFNAASLENQNAWKDFTNREVESGRTKMKESLEKLAKAYTVFLKISEVSKKTLPL